VESPADAYTETVTKPKLYRHLQTLFQLYTKDWPSPDTSTEHEFSLRSRHSLPFILGPSAFSWTVFERDSPSQGNHTKLYHTAWFDQYFTFNGYDKHFSCASARVQVLRHMR
jgi:hypothetical protein